MRDTYPHPNARRLRRRRRNAGMTLVEIMIVVIIMALIATGVAVLVIPQLERANVRQTETDVQSIRAAALSYITYDTRAECPSVQTLIDEDYLDTETRTEDAWGNQFDIECDGRNVYVSSAGPDGEFGNEDDVPRAEGGR